MNRVGIVINESIWYIVCGVLESKHLAQNQTLGFAQFYNKFVYIVLERFGASFKRVERKFSSSFV